ncbi:hypothetical protein AQUCO_08800013v1 [Aquilegia coerulea]|uniref:Cation/H+ exchanger transmembrane domain-containing protein n=1 Tax=Aquilegia coerulea TaxID=218851 RepID=A0A2G5C690_AQUCA|nr:hypothetical protein AQUCO_08800013v1 [Aquilegia coerulea]
MTPAIANVVFSVRDYALNSADHSHVVSISVFVAVICLCIVIGHLLEENRWVNESITAIVIGCISGTIILLMSKGTSSHILRFDENLFFIYLLPPIIFNAGFQVKKKQFFRNFGTIMLFGVFGVFISSAIISAGSWWLFPKMGFVGLGVLDYLAIGTIFSSTDTVCTLQVLHQDQTPLLYSLVFGEGVVNDATSVVLFNAIQKIDVSKLNGWAAAHIIGDFLYLFFTSTALGIAVGLVTAYAIKELYFGRHSTDREIALMSLMAYLSYLLAEAHICNNVIYCRDIHFPICWDGCSRHREVENEQNQFVDSCWYRLYYHLPRTTWTCSICVSSLRLIKLFTQNRAPTNYTQTPDCHLVGWFNEGCSFCCSGFQSVHIFRRHMGSSPCYYDH